MTLPAPLSSNRPGRAGRRPIPPLCTLALEPLEERWQPSTLTPNQPIMPPYPTALVQPSRYVIATPSPVSLVGKTAELSILEDFQITAVQQQADGSFTFTGTFDGHAVTGTISARRFGGPLLTTAGVGFSGSWLDSNGLQHRVRYAGTLNIQAVTQ